MTKQEFLAALEEALEVEPGTLKDDLVFSDMESWDSMTALIFMAVVDETLGVTVSGDQIAECKTMGELLALVSDQFTG